MGGVLLGLLLLAVPALAGGGTGEIKTFKLKHGGYDRVYRLYVPAGLDKAKKYPLLLILHGGGGTGKGMRRLTGYCFEKKADAAGALVAYPDGVDKNWNDFRGDPSRKAQRENVDDVAFLTEVAARVSAKYPVDPARVYAAGMSNGAMMSYTLACRAAGIVAAVAPVAGSMPENLAAACAPSRPVPLLIINGTEDKLVHWEGGDVTGPFGRKKLGRVLPVEKARDFWLEKNGCDRAKAVRTSADESAKDGTSMERERYSSCAGGAEVDFVKVKGGGHTWPGGMQYLPEFIIGKTSDEMAASDEIWDFFMRHALPAGK
ncbi:MAG: extracellular catalytic domain type 1 short-chain-length polyhydroxyalkanoate depolymerase [Elusimicrobiales bacterium]